MWKLLTGVIAEEMYNYLEREKILPEEQKGCKRGIRGTKDQLLIDKTVLKDCKKRHTNLSIAWIDYRKAFHLVPDNWVNEYMEIFGIAENLKTFLQKSMQQWRLSLTANGEDLREVNVKRGDIPGRQSITIVLNVVPLSLILKKVNACYKWGKSECKLNYVLFMDDLKLYAKSEGQTNTLVRTVHVFSTDIGMEFGIKKCGILTMKRGKIVKSEGIKLPDGEVMKQVGQEGYTYLDTIELNKIRETEMKEKITKEYKQRQRLILKSKLNGRNKVTAINTWAVAVLRYVARIIQWKASELNDLDTKSRKTIMKYEGLYPKSDVERLYVKRKEVGRGFIRLEQCIREEESSLRFYVANSQENLIKWVSEAETINMRETIASVKFKKQKAKELKEN